MGHLADFGMWASTVLMTVTKVAYPSYASYNAIVSKGDADDTTWLIYWVVVVVEAFISAFVVPFVSWVPFFMLLRLLFYIWLQFPVFNGSVYLFTKFVQPFFEENQKVFNVIAAPDSDEAKAAKVKARKQVKDAYLRILHSIEHPKDKNQ